MKAWEYTPPQTLVSIYRKIPSPGRAAFFSAFFGGLLVHLYRLCNMAMVVETPYYFYSENNRTDHGRWLLHHVTNLTSWLDMPYLNGVTTILYLATAAALLAVLFSVENKLTAGLMGLILAASPATAVLIHFSYLGDGFAAGFLLAVLAVFCIQRELQAIKWKGAISVAVGSVLLCCALAIYQSGLDVAAFLCVCLLLQGLLEQKGFYLRQFRRFLLMGAFGSGLYFALTQLILSISGTGLTEHAGLNTMGSFDLAASLRKLLWLYFDREHPYMNLLVYPTSLIWQLIGWLGLAAFGLTMVLLLVQKQLYRAPVQTVWYLALLMAMPAAIWLLSILQPQAGGKNALQGFSSALLWLALLAFSERLCLQPARRRIKMYGVPRFLQWGAWGCCLLLAIHFAIFDNQVYVAARVSYEKDMAACNRLLSRLEQVEGYTPETTICIQGKTIRYAEEGNYDTYGQKLERYFPALQPRSALYGQASYLNFLNTFLGTAFKAASAEEEAGILASDEYARMQVWPAVNAVQMIDGVLVVRLWE